jgi:hypothetical protein
MRRLSPKEIIESVPDVQSIALPEYWFDNIDNDKSVFTSLCLWVIEKINPSDENCRFIYNRIYIGVNIYKKFLSAEKKRLGNKLNLKGSSLEEAVSWSDVSTGPKTKIGGVLEISGDCILFIPESSKEQLDKFSLKMYKQENQRLVKKIKDKAAGASFYLWLISQIERPDRVGDLARDVESDVNFKKDATCYEEAEESFGLNAWGDAVGSLKQAWIEYSSQYPERIHPHIWCFQCNSKVEVENSFFASEEYEGEICLLCNRCIEKYKGFYQKNGTFPLILQWKK